MKRIVIKIGTKILTTASHKLDLNNLRRLVNEISSLHAEGVECILVSSGSITCGSEILNIQPKSMPQKQASASVGQLLLLREYQQFFTHNNLHIGQILLTQDVLNNDIKQINVTNTINTLLSHNIIPIINENDSVSTDEIQFGDNDILASIVARICDVDLLAILTDEDGVYDKNPQTNSDASFIFELSHISDDMINDASEALSSSSKGGMKSKLIASRAALECGIPTVIANGRHRLPLKDILFEKKGGTWFSPEQKS